MYLDDMKQMGLDELNQKMREESKFTDELKLIEIMRQRKANSNYMTSLKQLRFDKLPYHL